MLRARLLLNKLKRHPPKNNALDAKAPKPLPWIIMLGIAVFGC